MHEQLDLGDQRHTARHRSLNRRRVDRYAGRNGDQVEVGKRFRGKAAGKQLGFRHRRTQHVDIGRRRPAVDDAHAGALARKPARHRQPGFTEADDEDAFAGEVHDQRIFSVDRPTSTSMMVMIQKRTTTWVSFQPPSSKW